MFDIDCLNVFVFDIDCLDVFVFKDGHKTCLISFLVVFLHLLHANLCACQKDRSRTGG